MTEIFFINIITAILFIIINSNPIYSLLALITCFINFSMVLFLLQLDFMALVYILVYVGAICVLFLFVILLLNLRNYVLKKEFNTLILFCLMIALFIIFILNISVENHQPQMNLSKSFIENQEGISTMILAGWLFFTTYWEYLLLSMMLLLLGVIGTLMLTLIDEIRIKAKKDFIKHIILDYNRKDNL